METIKNIFGTYIRIIRINSNISQENLVRELNLLGLNTTQTVISRIENGTRELYDYELYCICKVLNIDIVKKDFVYYKAGDWSNKRIQAYLDYLYMAD